MALDPEKVGATTDAHVHRYTWRDVVLYNLSVGVRRESLDFAYEKRGPRVLPSYAVVPAWPAVEELFGMVGGDLLGVVHGAQDITLHKPFAPEGELHTTGRVAGVFDLKRLAVAHLATETRDAEGELVAETLWNVVYRFDGGFGGERPPRPKRARVPEGATPRFEETVRTTEEQALLYRLNGDLNPLHADPDVAKEAGFDAPILHGLCTYGFVTEAVVRHLCGGDPARLASLTGAFKQPVMPGETLILRGFDGEDEGEIILEAYVEGREKPVFGDSRAFLRGG